jgi:hypothetical protein
MSGITRGLPIMSVIRDTAATGATAHPTTGHPIPPSYRFIDRPDLILDDIPDLIPDIVPRPISLDTEAGQVLNRSGRALQTIDRPARRHRMELALRRDSRVRNRFGRLPRRGLQHQRLDLLLKPVRQRRRPSLRHRLGLLHKHDLRQQTRTSRRHNSGRTLGGIVEDKVSRAEGASLSFAEFDPLAGMPWCNLCLR